MHYPARITVLGTPIDPYTMDQTLQRTEEFISEGRFAHLIGVNADKVLQSREDYRISSTLARCELINADGASIVLAARWLRVPVPERVAGIDLMNELCRLAQRHSYSIYLLGAKPSVVELTRNRIAAKFPRIEIAGIRNGYFDAAEYAKVAEELRSIKPNIVFVGITSPKKEELIEFFRAEGLKSVFVGVGGSFDVISGSIPRAPKWVQAVHFEWFFRMMQEPRRLFKRYLVGNSRFLLLLLREKFGA